MSEMIAKTKRLMIRTLDETDYETVLPLLKEGSIASQYADQPVFLEEFAYRVWKRIVANDYNGSSFYPKTMSSVVVSVSRMLKILFPSLESIF